MTVQTDEEQVAENSQNSAKRECRDVVEGNRAADVDE
jgi:hypothetical protein